MADNVQFVSIETELSAAMQLFDGLEKESPKIRRRLLTGVGTSVKNRAKKQARQLLKKRSGNLFNSIKRRVVKSGKAVVIDAKARAANQVFYGYALAEGSKIVAKNEPYLHFKIEDKWVRVHEVQLPTKDYIVQPANKYLGSVEYRQQLDRLIQKEVDKLEKKGIVINR